MRDGGGKEGRKEDTGDEQRAELVLIPGPVPLYSCIRILTRTVIMV